jgi:hypothetical protein
MAHIWIQNPDGTGWGILRLTGEAYDLSERTLTAIAGPGCGPDGLGPAAMVVRRDTGPQEHWLLLARKDAHIQVNGSPLVLGARLLCDRDEIVVRVNGSPAALHAYFSTERQAEVVPFPGVDDAEIRCPRCKQVIRQGQMAVRCPNPGCGVWHHQDEESKLLCWTYGSTCMLCPHAARLDGTFRWTPEEL